LIFLYVMRYARVCAPVLIHFFFESMTKNFDREYPNFGSETSCK